MGKRTSRGRALAGLLATGVLLAAVMTPAGAGVEDNKTYTLTVAGVGGAATYAGDADSQLTITVTNTSPSQQLGSANVTVPSPLALVGVVSGPADTVPGGPVLELRQLAIPPGGSRSVTIEVDVRTCAATTVSISATAKQSNDYSGVGNDFYPNPATATRSVTGPCSLAFVDDPADADKNTSITSVEFDSDGAPITVEVLDASGTGRATHSTAGVRLTAHRAGATSILLGTVPTNAVNGLATFSPGPTIAVSAFDYWMTAASTGLTTSPLSAQFDIVDEHAVCPAGQACDPVTATAGNGAKVTADFNEAGSTSVTTTLLVSINAADRPNFACKGYAPSPDLPVSQFSFTDDAGIGRVGTMVASIPNATRPLNTYQVCWAAPYQFTNKAGVLTVPSAVTKPVTGEALHIGLLPDCPRRSTGSTGAPCIVSRTYTKSTKTVSVTVRATGDDPWRY